jgi:hypothetical protein
MNGVYLLPTMHQRAAAAFLGLVGMIMIYRMVRRHTLREEHALLWFTAIVVMLAVIWIDSLLLTVTGLLGIAMPGNALILLTIFFLFLISVRLSSVVSIQKRQIAKLIMEVSILKGQITNDVNCGPKLPE